MTDPRTSRGLYGPSHSGIASGSRSPSGSVSRPFLAMLNPTSRYQGYTQAASLLEEDEEEEGQRDSTSNRRVSWDEGSQMNTLRRNEDRSSDDDEVPQSLMFETTPTKTKGKQPFTTSSRPARPARTPDSILPTVHPIQMLPPKPSDLIQPPPVDLPKETPKAMRGLDAYERALWNWVNVYNLDSYLQEVYTYYEGKGIYCIALSQALNLLSVSYYSESLCVYLILFRI